MAFANSQNAGALAEQYNLTPYTRQMEVMASIAEHDTTVLGESAERVSLGLKSGGVRWQGLLDSSNDASYESITAVFAPTTAKIVTVHPEATTAGNPAVLCYAWGTELGAPVSINEYNALTSYFKAAEDGVEFGVWLQSLSAVTATGNGTAVDNGAATTNGGVAVLHTTAIAGAAPSVVWKVQHSTDGSTWADLAGATFTAQTTAGAQRLEVAAGTTVNRHLRAVRTFGGTTTSITSAVAFARR